jgi:hypothetical protein
MMVTIIGPMTLRSVPVALNSAADSPEIHLLRPEPWTADAATLGEALAAYEREFHVRFRPYDGSLPEIRFEPGAPPKFFFLDEADGNSMLMDIHIQRGREEICPKQDLNFPLLDGDEIRIGPLAC